MKLSSRIVHSVPGPSAPQLTNLVIPPAMVKNKPDESGMKPTLSMVLVMSKARPHRSGILWVSTSVPAATSQTDSWFVTPPTASHLPSGLKARQ